MSKIDYEQLADEWLKTYYENPSLTIAKFLEGRVDDTQRQEALEIICNKITEAFRIWKRTSEATVRVSEVTMFR